MNVLTIFLLGMGATGLWLAAREIEARDAYMRATLPLVVEAMKARGYRVHPCLEECAREVDAQMRLLYADWR